MSFRVFKKPLYWITRPLAKAMVYPGSIRLFMSEALRDAQRMKAHMIDLGGEGLQISTSDGRLLDAMFFDSGKIHTPKNSFWEKANSSSLTVIFCGGNGMLFEHAWTIVKFFLTQGLNVMAFNYGGYGDSVGPPTVENTYKDIEAIFQHVTEKKSIPSSRIVVYGLSIGGAMAAHLASIHPVHLVLDKAFTTIGEVPKVKILGILADFLYPYDNISKIKAIKGNIHIVKSNEDELITGEHGERFFQEILRTRHPSAENSEKEALHSTYVTLVPGNHNACWMDSTPAFFSAQNKFIETFLKTLI
ncbi:MAG: pimeloyl-ACP methyl ester carboxylesterase [Chlamydiales bacterium]|jgi:pimeloyl-ACP methyl ester carboxylesterase